jgi:hypothetical protein
VLRNKDLHLQPISKENHYSAMYVAELGFADGTPSISLDLVPPGTLIGWRVINRVGWRISERKDDRHPE